MMLVHAYTEYQTGIFLEETTMIYVIPVDEILHDIWHCVSYYFDSIRYDTSQQIK